MSTQTFGKLCAAAALPAETELKRTKTRSFVYLAYLLTSVTKVAAPLNRSELLVMNQQLALLL